MRGGGGEGGSRGRRPEAFFVTAPSIFIAFVRGSRPPRVDYPPRDLASLLFLKLYWPTRPKAPNTTNYLAFTFLPTASHASAEPPPASANQRRDRGKRRVLIGSRGGRRVVRAGFKAARLLGWTPRCGLAGLWVAGWAWGCCGRGRGRGRGRGCRSCRGTPFGTLDMSI